MMPGVASFPITSRKQWLKLRENDVTASVIGALFREHEYQTALGLWALKSKDSQGRPLIAEDPEETAPMRRGRLLEDDAIEMLIEDYPDLEFRRGAHYFRHTGFRIGATPDCFAVCPKRGLGNIQIKQVEPSIFRKKWPRNAEGKIEPPAWIAIQAIIEANLTGCSWTAVAPMRVSFGIEIDIVEIEQKHWDNVWSASVAAVAEFWRRVESGEGYPPDYGRDGATIALLNQIDKAKLTLDLRGDNMIGELLDEREAMTAQEKAAAERLKAIKAEIVHKLGTSSHAITADGREIIRSIVEVDEAEEPRKAYSYEKLVIRKPRERKAA